MEGTELHEAKRGFAAAIACLVQTINESDPTFQERLIRRLEQGYYEVRDASSPSPTSGHALDALSWIREMLTGFSLSQGKGEPFLSHYEPPRD